MSCFLLLQKTKCGIVANEFLARPQSFKLELTHRGEVYVAQIPSIFCQKLGQLTVPSRVV